MTGNSATDGSGYPGQGDVTEPSSEFNAQSFLAEQIVNRIVTMKLVKVVAAKAAGEVAAVGFVDVQPLVNQTDGQLGNSTPHGTIFGVPYFRVQGGANAVIMDPKVGDVGLMVVADRDISVVKATKKQGNPGSLRKFSASDGVYLGGILNGVPEQYVRFLADGMEIVDKNANKLEFTAAGIVVNGVTFNRSSQVEGSLSVKGSLQLGGAIVNISGGRYGGNIDTSGNITSGTIGLGDHHHTAQGANAATTGPQP